MRRRTAFTLGISTTAALTLVAGITGTSLATAAESPAAPRAEALYVPPANPDALVHIAELKAAGAQEDAEDQDPEARQSGTGTSAQRGASAGSRPARLHSSVQAAFCAASVSSPRSRRTARRRISSVIGTSFSR